MSYLLSSFEEILQKSIVTIYVSIDGGLQPQDVVFSAIAAAFASYTSIRQWSVSEPSGLRLRVAISLSSASVQVKPARQGGSGNKRCRDRGLRPLLGD